jgi:hypothetical protein
MDATKPGMSVTARRQYTSGKSAMTWPPTKEGGNSSNSKVDDSGRNNSICEHAGTLTAAGWKNVRNTRPEQVRAGDPYR